MAERNKRLGEAVEDYLRHRQARFAPTTVQQEGYVLRRFVACIGDVQLRHLRAERVGDWFYGAGGLRSDHVTRDGVHRSPIKGSTHNYYRTRLGSFFRFAQQRGWLRDDPLAEVAPMKVERRQRQQPPPETLLRMLEVANNPRDRAYLALLVNTALRANEVVRIRVGDVDLDGLSLYVVISKTHEEDALPITSDLEAELHRWLTIYRHELGRPLHVDDHLFPARSASVYRGGPDDDGVRPRRPTSWVPGRPVGHTERIVQDSLRALGLPTKDEGSHTIRRAVARAFFDDLTSEAGYDAALRTVAALLHHKSVATSEHYLGLSSERERRDKHLRGQPFLSAMGSTGAVIPLRRSAER